MAVRFLQTPSGRSEIVFGAQIEELSRRIAGRRAAVIVDATVHDLVGDRMPDIPTLRVGPGEASKTLAEADRVWSWLLAEELDRDSVLIGVGGGAACDLAGFVAATFLRGVELILAPTTLLAQVDAAIGGKNAVNVEGYKNVVGTFLQPSLVLCDPTLLSTLPEDEIANGLAEIIKAGALGDLELLALLEGRADDLLALAPDPLDVVIARSVAVKATLVEADERERGPRRLLNLGHTVGHAVERVARWPHGRSVAVGLVAAARLSRELGRLSVAEVDRLERLVARLGLPTEIPGELDAASLIASLRRDKKRADDELLFVVLDGLGAASVLPLPLRKLEKVLARRGTYRSGSAGGPPER